MGIDLAGKDDNPTGMCVLNLDTLSDNDGKGGTPSECEIYIHTVYGNDEILENIQGVNPNLIIIDAPLSLPEGRCCLEKDCECSVGGHFRQSEREIRRYGPVLPLTFTGMKMLTMRGVGLARNLSGEYLLKETHPRTVGKMLGFHHLKRAIGEYLSIPPETNEHEMDAILAALCGYFYINDCYLELGDPKEGTIILPRDPDCLKMVKKLKIKWLKLG